MKVETTMQALNPWLKRRIRLLPGEKWTFRNREHGEHDVFFWQNCEHCVFSDAELLDFEIMRKADPIRLTHIRVRRSMLAARYLEHLWAEHPTATALTDHYKFVQGERGIGFRENSVFGEDDTDFPDVGVILAEVLEDIWGKYLSRSSISHSR